MKINYKPTTKELMLKAIDDAKRDNRTISSFELTKKELVDLKNWAPPYYGVDTVHSQIYFCGIPVFLEGEI